MNFIGLRKNERKKINDQPCKENSPIGEPLGEDRGEAALKPDRKGILSYLLEKSRLLQLFFAVFQKAAPILPAINGLI